MKTGTLTFHASHNYGSMLQAYALQKSMIEIFGNNEIINLRTPYQKKMMKVISFRKGIAPLLKNISHIPYYFALTKKYNLFEDFLKSQLILSQTEIPNLNSDSTDYYDLICSGSDQIWNTGPADFNPGYLIPFEIPGIKISYAVSMGPGANEYPEPISKFPVWLKDFKRISVREEGTKITVCSLSGRNDVEVHCDPVLLLEKDKWMKFAGNEPIIKGKYIFLYTVFANPLVIKCGKVLQKKYGCPVIISNFTNIHDLFSPFKKKLKSGPREFLNYIKFADKVITTSFHGTAFSILLNKPFVSVGGERDNRISNLLNLTQLLSRNISTIEEIKSIDWNIDFSEANKAIEKERQKAMKYLQECKVLAENNSKSAIEL